MHPQIFMNGFKMHHFFVTYGTDACVYCIKEDQYWSKSMCVSANKFNMRVCYLKMTK